MAKPKMEQRIEDVLNEGRILMLGGQILIGFEYRAVLEPGFATLSMTSRVMILGSLGLMLLAIGLLLLSPAYHRIVERGGFSERFLTVASMTVALAPLPFATGLGADLFVAAEKVRPGNLGWGAAIVGTVVALYFWYGLEWIARRDHGWRHELDEHKDSKKKEEDKQSEDQKLEKKIEEALIEARMILPGAQALLGFQFIIVLMSDFAKLPSSLKWLHLGSLALVALSTVFLMTPAAYHRIVEKGDATEHFHSFTSKMVLASLVPLALGICGDFYLVSMRVVQRSLISAAFTVAALVFFFGLWFGYTFWERRKRDTPTIIRAT